MSTDGAAAGIRQAHIAAAPRIALQQTFTARARDLGSSGSELPSQQSLQQIEETLGWVREYKGGMLIATWKVCSY